jgi:hypothetical protein
VSLILAHCELEMHQPNVSCIEFCTLHIQNVATFLDVSDSSMMFSHDRIISMFVIYI